MKRYFFGKYYKFISPSGFSFAAIISESNDGPELQIITGDGAHVINDKHAAQVIDNRINFFVKQNDITLQGEIILGELHPLKKHVMGPFRFLPLECKHAIYSMFHSLSGSIVYNNQTYSFTDGYGYIEGDAGVNFPKKYIWYNSTKSAHGITLAIASIPIAFVKFTGLLCFIKTKDQEIYLSTYNGAKPIKITPTEIVIKKRKYVFTLKVLGEGGHLLKAPVQGKMDRYIKENLRVKTAYTLKKNNTIILDEVDELSSLEYMF